MVTFEEVRGRNPVVLASTGGHLAQAVKWAQRLDFSPRSLFVTFDSQQSRTLLRHWDHLFVPYVPPRDVVGACIAALRLLASEHIRGHDSVFSTGAGLALSGLPLAYRHNLPYFYVESVSRFEGPSATGRVLQRLPRIDRFTQHDGYDSRTWVRVPSLLGDFTPVGPSDSQPPDRPLKVFVSLGTIRPYRFDRLIESVLAVLRPGDDVVWQLGASMRENLPGTVHETMDAASFRRLCEESDVVITHGGVGTIMGLLDMERRPIVVPRLAKYGEHVDDHQLQVVRELVGLGVIAEVLESDSLTRDLLKSSSNVRVVRSHEGVE